MKIQSVTFQGSGERLGTALPKKVYYTCDGQDVVYEPAIGLVFVIAGPHVLAKHVSLCARLDLTATQVQGLLGDLRKAK